MLNFTKIGHRIIAAVGAVVALGLTAMVLFYAHEQETSIMAQNERAMEKVTESVSHGLQTVMLAGYADIAQAFAASLKAVPEVDDFRIMRRDGLEAFQDNKTIIEVNKRRGEEDFFPRDEEFVIPVMPAGTEELQAALKRLEVVNFYETRENGERFLTFLSPILNDKKCHKCHGDDHKVRGLIKLTSTLRPIELEIQHTWKQSMVVLAISLVVILFTTNWMVRRTVVHPIKTVTNAMELASTGNLNQEVPVLGRDELGAMATSFNRMTSELLSTYTGLHHEQNKLTTIILSAQEGIVVTDGANNIVLVNPAAETLLGKSAQEIMTEGFDSLFDDPVLMAKWIKRSKETLEPNTHEYKDRLLSVSVSTIEDPDGGVIGSSALVRDVTAQKKLEDELRMLSNTDGMTRLFNRRFLDKKLAEEVSRSYRYGDPLSILFFDVDHFKKFNDTHGHDQGDRVLISIADIMRDSTRTVDFPCRYGGEEFLIILPSTAEGGAMILAERFRERVQNTPVDGLSVTISIGVGSLERLRPKTADDFLAMADAALYQAKENGRNCVVLAQPGMEGEEEAKKKRQEKKQKEEAKRLAKEAEENAKKQS